MIFDKYIKYCTSSASIMIKELGKKQEDMFKDELIHLTNIY